MKHKSPGFTIVELLIVIVIIGILATIVIVAYNGITRKAQDATLQSDLKNASTTLEIANATDGTYPSDDSSLRFSPNTNHNYSYNSSNNTYCLEVSSTKTTNVYSVTNGSAMANGACPLVMQTITTANCPGTMTRAYDARDNHTYWVQKLADGKCWMLTNLGYAGGGTNTYSDTRALTNGTGGTTTYTVASYYVVPSTTNFTTEPTAPSTSTTGTGQYGYLYNWCAAMGGQTGNGACSSSDATQPNVNTTICPKNWRLPTGNGGEFGALNIAVNSGSTSVDNGLRSAWLAQYGGNWPAGFFNQGTSGNYWSSTVNSTTSAYNLNFSSTYVSTANSGSKGLGFAVRCLAAV